MKTEYEAKFTGIQATSLKQAIQKAGGALVRSEFLQKRVTFDLPQVSVSASTWIRLRDEGGCVTLTLKSTDEKTIAGQKEILVNVGDFRSTAQMLQVIGCQRKSYQESRREVWKMDGVEITFDTWPFLDTFVEIEGESEASVKQAARLLGLDYAQALFGSVNTVYIAKYGRAIDDLDPAAKANFTFDSSNPFDGKVAGFI